MEGSRVSAESFLSSAAEIAIGIAGFAGIIAAIRQGRITHWPPGPRLLLEMLLAASGLALLFALLPAILVEAGVSHPTTWQSGSALIFVSQLGLGVLRTRQFRAAGWTMRAPIWMGAWYSSFLLLQGVNVALGTSWLYLLGVLGLLGNGFFFFLQLLFADWDHTSPAA